ncbi:MAG: TatD family hydrolase [Desulfobacterales bacterium]|nr:TatD family hydrolase [Desulfobacterales bacterium]
MRLFDSHCHLDDRAFDQDIEQTLHRAEKADVHRFMIVGISEHSSTKALEIAKCYGNCYSSVGVHPHYAKHCRIETINTLKKLTHHPKVKAWGEIGLDFDRMHSPPSVQEKWFINQLETAIELKLPIIFHERSTKGRLLDLLTQHKHDLGNGVIHCFTGTLEEMQAYVSMGLYIGITAIVTMTKRGENLRRIIPHIPLERLLIETDSPYLLPEALKKQTQRNEPAFVRYTLDMLCTLKNLNIDHLSERIWQNTCNAFGITD